MLVGYFVLALALIAAALCAVAYVALNSTRETPVPLGAWLAEPYWLYITAAVVAVVAAGSAYTSLKLRGGGPALAAMVGARTVDPATSNTNERRLLNVVEEMSIASGTPTPALYVLDDEASINAFVAGTRPSETVMVVTRGALENFDRDELQGVVAHEFSHIFNNDMRLNLRLMGVLAGILVIGQFGRVLLRSGAHGRGREAGSFAIAGLAILLIGYIGLFFGALIKASVSRQREFLADASAVQFTRYPRGIASALNRMRTHGAGSELDNNHAEDLSHFCFGASVVPAFGGLMATHPPLAARIEAIAPGFGAGSPSLETTDQPHGGAPDGAAISAFSGGEQVASRVGTVEPGDIGFASRVLNAMPEPLQALAHQPDGAVAVLSGLLVLETAPDTQADIRERVTSYGARTAALFDDALEQLAPLPDHVRLPLVQMTLPAIKAQDAPARRRILQLVKDLIAADKRLSVFEFALWHVLADHLRDGAARGVPVAHHRFEPVADALQVLLSALARFGHTDIDAAKAAFEFAWAPFGFAGDMLPAADCQLARCDEALTALAGLAPMLKRNVIQACADCVLHDGRVSAAEGALLQVVSIALDCPMPPLSSDR